MLISSIRKISPYNKRQLLLGKLFLSNWQRISIHIVADLYVNWGVFGNLNCSNTDNSGFLVLGHVRRSNSIGIRLIIFIDFILVDYRIPSFLLFVTLVLVLILLDILLKVLLVLVTVATLEVAVVWGWIIIVLYFHFLIRFLIPLAVVVIIVRHFMAMLINIINLWNQFNIYIWSHNLFEKR